MTRPAKALLDPALRATLTALFDEGWEYWARFDREVRSHHWHAFVPADYERVLDVLAALFSPGLRFLEWGSATGVVTIMADLLGYEAYGIELDEGLVATSLRMAARYGSGARFVAGSFLPTGYVWRPADGDGRLGTLGVGRSGYLELGRPLEDFDLVYAYPWGGEEAMMHDLIRVHGARETGLILQRVAGDVLLFRGGRLVPVPPDAHPAGTYSIGAPGPKGKPVRAQITKRSVHPTRKTTE